MKCCNIASLLFSRLRMVAVILKQNNWNLSPPRQIVQVLMGLTRVQLIQWRHYFSSSWSVATCSSRPSCLRWPRSRRWASLLLSVTCGTSEGARGTRRPAVTTETPRSERTPEATRRDVPTGSWASRLLSSARRPWGEYFRFALVFAKC